MSTMRVVQVPRPNGPLEIIEREVPDPAAGQVRIKVQACGICHSDTLTKEGTFPGIQYPRVPGHEVVGLIDAVGSNVPGWKPGQRVGVGWHGGQCGYCGACRRGDFFACETATRVTGITADGGYAGYMIARAEAVALVPATSSPCSASMGSATSACSSPRRWGSGPWPSHAGRTRGRWRESSAPGVTSTVRRRIRLPHCASWVAPGSSSRR